MMKDKIRNVFRKAGNERGDYMIMFAALSTVIFMLIGMTVDFAQIYVKRVRLREVGQIMREIRFETMPLFYESTDPEKTLEDILKEYAVKNGLKAEQVTVKVNDKLDFGDRNNTRKCTGRSGEIVITLTDSYNGIILPLFGIDTIEINPIVIPGSYVGGNAGSGEWYPALGDSW